MVPSFEIDDVAVTCFMPLAILITISLYESFGSHPFLAEVRVIVRPTLLLLHVKAARVRPKDSSAKSSLALNAKVDDTQNTHAAHSRLAQRVGIRETVETKKADKKPKTVRSYSRNQLYRSWGLGAGSPPRMGTSPTRPPMPGRHPQRTPRLLQPQQLSQRTRRRNCV